MNGEQYELPEEWRWAELAEVVEIGSDQVLPKRQPNKLFNYVALENVESTTGRLIDFAPTPGANIASNKYSFTPQHVLYGKLRPYLQKALVPDFEGVSATDLLPLRPNPEVLDRRFLWRWLLSYDVLEYVTARQTGVKMPRLRTGDLESMPVPLPPLPEQHLIVEKVERLLSESRTARDALGKVPALLKRFRQSVLAKAFQGALTPRPPLPTIFVGRGGAEGGGEGVGDEPASVLLERIREERRRKWEEGKGVRGKKYVEPEPPDTSDLPELPEGWEWASAEQCAEVRLGRQRSPSRATGPNMRPYLRAANVTWNGLDLSDVKEMDFSPAEQEIYRLRSGDVILAEASGSVSEVGKPAIWHEEIENCCIQNTLIRVRSEGPLPQYLYYHFLYDALTARFSRVTQGIGINHLGAKGLSHWVISIPPTNEQRRIVAKIESLFAQAEAIERAVEVARRRAEKVDQAVLARAFRGEL